MSINYKIKKKNVINEKLFRLFIYCLFKNKRNK